MSVVYTPGDFIKAWHKSAHTADDPPVYLGADTGSLIHRQIEWFKDYTHHWRIIQGINLDVLYVARATMRPGRAEIYDSIYRPILPVGDDRLALLYRGSGHEVRHALFGYDMICEYASLFPRGLAELWLHYATHRWVSENYESVLISNPYTEPIFSSKREFSNFMESKVRPYNQYTTNHLTPEPLSRECCRPW